MPLTHEKITKCRKSGASVLLRRMSELSYLATVLRTLMHIIFECSVLVAIYELYICETVHWVTVAPKKKYSKSAL